MADAKNKHGNRLTAIFFIILLLVSSFLCFLPILLIGVFKLVPYRSWQVRCTKWIDAIVTFWCGINNFFINKTQRIQWNISGLNHLDRHNWYLVTANHQSWLDIVILQRLFNRKIPVLKFFIKDQLKWLPLFGFAWWAMGCPFMKRYSSKYLEKRPHKRGKDLQATQKSVDIFKQAPTSIINFLEGTRFHPKKKQIQQSPYQHLLKPKAGGISYVLATMGTKIHNIIDVTIIYPEGRHSLWNFLCRRIHAVQIKIREIPIPKDFLHPDILNSEQKQKDFREWLNQQWFEKDKIIHTMKSA